MSAFQRSFCRSTAYAISAYFITLILERAIIVAGALLHGFSVVLEYNKVKVTADSFGWDQESVVLIYLAPFFLEVILSIFLYFRLVKMERTPRYTNIFILWLMFFTIYRATGIFPAHMICKTGVFHAINWLYFGIVFRIIAGLIAGALFLFFGYKFLEVIKTLSRRYNTNDLGRSNLILSTLILPLSAVIIIALLFFLPHYQREEIIGLTSIFILNAFVFFKMITTYRKPGPFKEGIPEKRNPLLILTLVLVAVIVLRVIIGFGFTS